MNNKNLLTDLWTATIGVSVGVLVLALTSLCAMKLAM